jgi:arginine/ornithine N-succinyltransferase beta subunit
VKDIFNVLSSELETEGLSWENYVDICTDGDPSMVGSITGFASVVKKKS